MIHLRVACRWSVAQGAVRPDSVLVNAPLFDQEPPTFFAQFSQPLLIGPALRRTVHWVRR